MSAAVATAASSRRNSSSITHTAAPSPPLLANDRRRMSATVAAAGAVASPPAPVAAGGVRMTSLAQAAALATAEAERRAAAARAAGGASGSPQSVKSMSASSRQTRSNSSASTRMSAMKAAAVNASAKQSSAAPAASTQKPKPRTKQSSREVVLTTSRTSHTPATADTLAESPDAMVHLTIGMLGLKFKCRVQRAWPCEAMIATAIAEYHLAYPACEIPDFNTIYHLARKEFLKASEPIGASCADDDELELGITEKPSSAPSAASARSEVSAGSSDGGRREMFDFMILFHRLPLGFTLKQNNEHIVVANIYPHSTATHYERLETGVRVVKIADTLLENLGLRQVHDLIKNAKIPLEICFRGFTKPSLRATLLMAAANPTTPAAAAESRIPTRRQSVPSPKPEDDGASSVRSTRERARTASNASARRVELVTTQSQPSSEQQVSAMSGGRRSGRSRRGSQESKDERELHQPRDTRDNQTNSNNNSHAGLSSVQPPSRRARASSRNMGHAASAADNESAEPTEVRHCDGDSNQNEDGDETTEERLVDQIKALQVALLKKHEEAKQIARQIEQFHDKLAAVRSAKSSKHAHTEASTDPDADLSGHVPAPSHSMPASTTAVTSSSSASLKLRLTPEVLEAMDSKAGVPPKSASYYQSSNVSSVSGYSNYSNRSNAAPRHSARPSRRTAGAEHMRSDVSVASHSSATSDRRRSSSKSRSPRAQCVKNINNRYSYIPQKYSSGSSSAEAPTSLSSRGAVMSRAKATRDSFITKSESPGVGYYDVKLPTSHVRGGEIGDSDRSLPWP